MSMSSTNLASTLGGQWERIGKGMTIVGEGTNEGYTFEVDGEQTTVGATTNPKGEYTHQLSVDEMPSHTHELNMGWGAWSTDGTKGRADGHSPANRWSMNSAGGDQAHNNIQPYIVTYMWKRIS